MARYVEDLALILPSIAGPDGQDPAIAPVPLGEPEAVRLRGRRAVFYTDNGILPPTPEIAGAVQAAARALEGDGVIFEERRPPGIEDSLELIGALMRGWDGGAWARLLLAKAGTAESDTTLTRYLSAPALPASTVIQLIERWDQFRARLLTFFNDYELILSPVNAYPALPHGQVMANYAGCSYTLTYNLTGWPGAVVRVGTSPEGLPLGVQLVARPWREDVALAVARRLEEHFGGWQPPEI
jgi:amidase